MDRELIAVRGIELFGNLMQCNCVDKHEFVLKIVGLPTGTTFLTLT